MQEGKHILLCGAGAVGTAIGASLCSQGMQVCFLAKGNTLTAIRTGGVSRTGLFGEIHIPPSELMATDDAAQLPDAWAEYVLVCTKTLANAEIAETLHLNRAKLAPGARIVILQNGWENDHPFRAYFSESELYQARVITGFARPAPGVSEITVHTAPILFGSLYGYDTDCIACLPAAICASGIPADTTQDLAAALWAKMLYNTTLNPLGAVLHLPYGKLADSPAARAIMDSLIDESFAVMQAAGYHTFWESAEDYRAEFYGKLVPDTRAHRSSTLQDIEKKQKTEIDTLNGCIVRLADEHGIPVPTHRLICRLIRALEENY